MATEQREQIAETVRTEREARGWSQARLAREAGVAENTVLAIESGTRRTQPGKLRAVFDALGLAPVQDENSLDLTDVPDDARRFLLVLSKRFRTMDEETRAEYLNRAYFLLVSEFLESSNER